MINYLIIFLLILGIPGLICCGIVWYKLMKFKRKHPIYDEYYVGKIPGTNDTEEIGILYSDWGVKIKKK